MKVFALGNIKSGNRYYCQENFEIDGKTGARLIKEGLAEREREDVVFESENKTEPKKKK
ncbi:hypothetical protein KAR91_70260 [Candidatus Pacearchaeota archaeon]|nr:hypothetical protein [Candidatus Pacearchaeota archaeon]